MKKILALVVGVIMMSQSVVAEGSFPQPRSLQPVTTSGSGVSVNFQGVVEAPIISAIIPTQVRFVVIPDSEGWNQILSPDFTVRNVGNVALDVSISKTILNSPDIEFTTSTPVYNNGTRQVRIGVAPKNDYPSVVRVSDYLFTSRVNDSNPIVLTERLNFSLGDDTATYGIYGDISPGWQTNDEFSISAVFRVSMS